MPTASVSPLTVESFLSSLLAPVPGNGSASLSDGSSTNVRCSRQHKTLSSGGVSTSLPSDVINTSTSAVSETVDTQGPPSVTVFTDAMAEAKTFLQLHNLLGMGVDYIHFSSFSVIALKLLLTFTLITTEAFSQNDREKFSSFKLVIFMGYPHYQYILLCHLSLYPIGRGGYDKNIDRIQG